MSVQGRTGLRRSGTPEDMVTPRWAEVMECAAKFIYARRNSTSRK